MDTVLNIPVMIEAYYSDSVVEMISRLSGSSEVEAGEYIHIWDDSC